MRDAGIVVNLLSYMNGKLYQLANKNGIDMVDFAEKAMLSDLGSGLLEIEAETLWTCEGYIFEWLTDELRFKRAVREYRNDIQMLVGCVYMHWVKTREISSIEVYKMAPYNVVYSLYDELHVNGVEYCVQELESIYRTGEKIKVDF